MNTPQITNDLYDELKKSTPFITCRSEGDPDPAKQRFSVVLDFRSLAEAQNFHTKLCRFSCEWFTDEMLTLRKCRDCTTSFQPIRPTQQVCPRCAVHCLERVLAWRDPDTSEQPDRLPLNSNAEYPHLDRGWREHDAEKAKQNQGLDGK